MLLLQERTPLFALPQSGEDSERFEKVRIAFVGTELCSLLSPSGGLEKMVRGWAMEIGRRHETFLIDVGSGLAGESDFEGVPVFSLTSPRELEATLKTINADVVQTNNRPLWDTGSTFRVNTFHNFTNAWSADGEIDVGAVSRALRGGAVTAVSNALARHIERVCALPEGEVLTSYPFVDDAFVGQAHLGGNGVLFPNRLIAKKGPTIVLQALEALGITRDATFLDYVTPFLHSSPDYQRHRRFILDSHAQLLNPIDSARELALLYAGADLVVSIATEPEGMGLVPLEAQAVGTRVVTAGPGGLREATFHPNIHLPKAEPVGLATAIAASLQNSARSTSKDVIRAKFNLDLSARELEHAWQRD
jgi:glycosyltransferase involved in cell wall biosynthesis